MLDRESTFADEKTVALLRREYVTLAVDVWYEERRRDAAGELYRSVVMQREGMREGRTTQGFYIFTADGKLVHGWNNRDAAKVRRFVRQARKARGDKQVGSVAAGADPRFTRRVPKGGAVIDVHSKILAGEWGKNDSRWSDILRTSRGRDHLWVLPSEIETLKKGRLPEALARRIARFHLIDNTRGEPPMWRSEEIKRLELAATPERNGTRISGPIHLETADGKRGFTGHVLGFIETGKGALERFDVVARGDYWGHGRYTQNPPKGRFRIAFAFTLADRNRTAAAVPPQGSRDLAGYLAP